MLQMTEVVRTFPSVSIPSASDGLPIEISLIAQLGHGAGNELFASTVTRQRLHGAFVDELDEPSTKLAGSDFAKGDATALYSFAVGPNGHPFHRHAGHRIFTAVSGSGGAQLRFSSASAQQINEDPHTFAASLRYVNIPPDCMFTVRFGGETWHQFAPLSRNSMHPVFFALSCHTNELGGNLTAALKEKVIANAADIPALTELLPDNVLKILESKEFRKDAVPTTTLSLDAPDGTFHRVVCNTVRSGAGILRGAVSAWRDASGYLTKTSSQRVVDQLEKLPEGSFLTHQLPGLKAHHEDTFQLTLTNMSTRGVEASRLLALVLEGFLLNAPTGVTGLMALRNVLVKPFGLRTSPLGCPVSSLLSPRKDNLFANLYPVLDQRISADNKSADVILGADDKHLSFRSCISVNVREGAIDVLMGTRVHCKNLFGQAYMAAIDHVHRRYISPSMLRKAVDYAFVQKAA